MVEGKTEDMGGEANDENNGEGWYVFFTHGDGAGDRYDCR